MTECRQNAMMADVIRAFRWRNAAIEQLKESSGTTRRQIESVKKRGATMEDHVHVLEVHVYSDLKDEQSIQNTITLYVGMALSTPFGDGVIKAIRPQAKQV